MQHVRLGLGSGLGDSVVVNSCRKLSPTGDFLNVTGEVMFRVRVRFRFRFRVRFRVM